MRRLLSAMALACLASVAQAGCGPDPDPCTVDLGSYHILLPEAPGPYPVLIFLHGYGSNGQNAANAVRAATDQGYAVIGPNGQSRDDRPRSWSFHPLREPLRDEAEFLRQVIADAARAHNIDTGRVLLAGFSIGGSMTSYIACNAPDVAQGYAPVGGSFWRPHPGLDACKAPVRLFHTHGWRDTVVPLEGRSVGGGTLTQGDVFYAFQVWRTTNGCIAPAADQFDTADGRWDRRWTTCATDLRLLLHPGGHTIPNGWTADALEWFEAEGS